MFSNSAIFAQLLVRHCSMNHFPSPLLTQDCDILKLFKISRIDASGHIVLLPKFVKSIKADIGTRVDCTRVE